MPRRRLGLGGRLLLSYLAIIAVGTVTLLVAADLAAPRFFEAHVAEMLAGSRMDSMRDGGMGNAATLDAALRAAFRGAVEQAMVAAGAAALVTAVAAAIFVTGRVIGPIRALVTASRRIAAGRYAERVPTRAVGELGDLARGFNAMAAALEDAERRRLQLVGDVAHELRTPVTTLRGSLEGLLDGVVSPDERTWARLHDEVLRLGRLIDDLQELSRAEARQIPLDVRPVDPLRIARVALARAEGPATDKGLTLVADIPPRLPLAQADEDRAVQVLTNLLVNAVRYTPSPGTIRVSVRATETHMEFAVLDSGLGIAPEHLPHVFERFYRVEKSRSRALGGSGIGLTIAQVLVDAMGGTLRVESPGPGRGSTFSFTLPR